MFLKGRGFKDICIYNQLPNTNNLIPGTIWGQENLAPAQNLHQDNLAPQFIDIYWTLIANSNYTLPRTLYLEHDSTRLFWPTIRMSVSDSICPWPLRDGGEFYQF